MNRYPALPRVLPQATGTENDPHPERRAALEALRLLTAEMAGRKLPGERELAKRLNISRQHLRALLDLLESEGVVERRQGSGTYARDYEAGEVEHVGLLIDARLKLGNDPFFSLLAERLQMALQAAGIHCVVERIDGEKRPRFLGQGVITVGLAGLGALAQFRPNDPPAVSLLAEEQDEPLQFGGRVSLLLADDRGAGIAAARRVLTEGCTHLIFLGRSDLPASRARWEGIQQAVRKLDPAHEVRLEILECSMNYASGRLAAQELTRRFHNQPIAEIGLLAANDWLAVGLRSGLAESGSPLRHNLMVSFDGLPIAEEKALNILSLKFPFTLIVEDTLAELRRLVRHRSGRVIRYAMEWADNPPHF